jgi:hypothetical protein
LEASSLRFAFREGRAALLTFHSVLDPLLVACFPSAGADVVLVQYLLQMAANPACAVPGSTNYPAGLSLDRATTAGWNTDGNSAGTAFSSAVVMHYFADYGRYAEGPATTARLVDALKSRRRAVAAEYQTATSAQAAGSAAADVMATAEVGAHLGSDPVAPCNGSCAAGYFTLLRVVEDCHYQALYRQAPLEAYIALVANETDYTLGDDLAFYQRFIYKPLASRAAEVASAFAVDWALTSAGFPWNRTFEISLFANTTAGQVANSATIS